MFDEDVTHTWIMANMIPGITTVGPFSVNPHTTVSIPADHVEISFSHIIAEATSPDKSNGNPEPTPGEMAKWLEITVIKHETVNFVTGHMRVNGNGIFDLEDATLAA